LHRESLTVGCSMGYLEEARQNHVKKKVEEGDLSSLLKYPLYFCCTYTVDLTKFSQLLDELLPIVFVLPVIYGWCYAYN
jgi:benzoyl-CoA reductase/2-hydroxyglutaryl-CoA dehydratase subunit BcrC/BadD/HgdB